MSGLWEPCQFNDESHVYCEPPSKLDAMYDDLLLKVTGNMLVEQKIEVAKMVCKQLNENATMREQLAAKDEALRLAYMGIMDYLDFEFDDDPWSENPALMREMELDDMKRDGRLEKIKAELGEEE